MNPTTEDVLKWAREAGFYPENAPAMNPILEKLAALAYAAGAADEREECAKVCEELDDGSYAGGDQPYGIHYARAIRARREP